MYATTLTTTVAPRALNSHRTPRHRGTTLVVGDSLSSLLRPSNGNHVAKSFTLELAQKAYQSAGLCRAAGYTGLAAAGVAAAKVLYETAPTVIHPGAIAENAFNPDNLSYTANKIAEYSGDYFMTSVYAVGSAVALGVLTATPIIRNYAKHSSSTAEQVSTTKRVRGGVMLGAIAAVGVVGAEAVNTLEHMNHVGQEIVQIGGITAGVAAGAVAGMAALGRGVSKLYEKLAHHEAPLSSHTVQDFFTQVAR